MFPGEIKDALLAFGREHFSPAFSILSEESLSGGCINNVQRLRTTDGDFCLKYNSKDAFPGMFFCESCGLDLLRTSGTLKVPEVITTGETGKYAFILLEFIASGRRNADMMEDFGRSLAMMHQNSEDYFGLDHDNYMGSLPQSNEQHDDWISFFIAERLEKQVRPLLDGGSLSSKHSAQFRKIYGKLEKLLPSEPPALLHGDLWGGNYMISAEGKAALIDPAVYYGHREADLAMTKLFGGFDETFYTSYHETYPLINGWKERVSIYQLYPLLIHLNLFGRSYLSGIEEILGRYA